MKHDEHDKRRRERGSPPMEGLLVALALVLSGTPLRAGGAAGPAAAPAVPAVFLPEPLRDAEVGRISLGLDGQLGVEDLRIAFVVGRWAIEATVRRLALTLPARGARVEGLTITIGPAAARDRASRGREASGEARDGLPARLRARASRLLRLLGPVDVEELRVVVLAADGRRDDRPVWEWGGLSGHLEAEAAGETLRGTLRAEMADVASALGVRIDAGSLTLDLELLPTADGALALRGDLALAGLVLAREDVAPEPLRLRSVTLPFSLGTDRELRKIELRTDGARLGSAAFDFRLGLRRRGRAWTVDARVELPEQPCAAAIGGVPDALLGVLREARWGGSVQFALSLRLDTARPRRLRLRLEGDPDRCVPTTLGAEMDARLAEIETRFALPVRDPSGAASPELRVGPGTPGYLPFRSIPGLIRFGALATEDRRFFRHQGVSLRLIQGALRVDLDKGGFAYGGSTITQQLVKNLLLSREKSIARKVQEVLLARELERRLSKERILALYLNCIEYGPGVYGITAAARFYFDKAPDSLRPLDVAFLMALKPAPRSGFRVFRAWTLNERWRRRLRTILLRMVKMDIVTEEAVEAAAPYQPAFRAYDPAVHRGYPRR